MKNVYSKFTIVELLVVVAVIAILAAMLLPALNRARDSAKRISCTNNIKQLGLGFGMYNNTYNDYLPSYDYRISEMDLRFWWVNIANMINPEINSTTAFDQYKPKYFQCPSRVKVGWDYNELSYGYNHYLGYFPNQGVSNIVYKTSQIRRPSQLIMCADGDGDSYYDSIIFSGQYLVGSRHHEGSPVAYVDGHVEWRKRVELSRTNAVPGVYASGDTTELQRMWGNNGWALK